MIKRWASHHSLDKPVDVRAEEDDTTATAVICQALTDFLDVS